MKGVLSSILPSPFLLSISPSTYRGIWRGAHGVDTLDSRKGAISTGATVGPDGLVWSVASRPVPSCPTLYILFSLYFSLLSLVVFLSHHVTSRHVTSRFFSSFLVTRVFFRTVENLFRENKKKKKKEKIK